MGDILLDVEKILNEVIDDHGLQEVDILYLIYGHIRSHRMDCVPVYEIDDSNPVLKYGHKDDV